MYGKSNIINDTNLKIKKKELEKPEKVINFNKYINLQIDLYTVKFKAKVDDPKNNPALNIDRDGYVYEDVLGVGVPLMALKKLKKAMNF